MKTFVSTLLIALLLVSAPVSLWAHGGSHDAKPKKEETTLPKLPEAAIDMKSDKAGGVDYGTGNSLDAFEMEEVGGGGALWGEEPQPEMSGHDMSKMNHVEPSEHEWVATSQKGYKWAAALTVLSGLLFGFLTFKRPCE